MDITSRKISFIQDFLKLQNEELLSVLENLLLKEKKESSINALTPMSIEDLNLRIDKSMEDSENNLLTDAYSLKEEIKKWR